MMRSAGILAYRIHQQQLEVLLVHPGGPFYEKKDEGVWSIPKGEYIEGEDAATVAEREFNEETGNQVSTSSGIQLSPIKLKSGKLVSAWAVEADFENCFIGSNSFVMEWPPKSGKMESFPEVDKAAWFSIDEAEKKIHAAQIPFLNELRQKLNAR